MQDTNQLNSIYCELSILFLYKSSMAELTKNVKKNPRIKLGFFYYLSILFTAE